MRGWRKWHGKEERVGEEGDGESDMLSKDAAKTPSEEEEMSNQIKKRGRRRDCWIVFSPIRVNLARLLTSLQCITYIVTVQKSEYIYLQALEYQFGDDIGIPKTTSAIWSRH